MADRKYRDTWSRSFAGDGGAIYFSSGFTADELEVAGILVHLPGVIKKSESSRRFPAVWGSKKKRSVISSPDSDSPAPAPAPELSFTTGKLEDVSTSPISPLAYPSPADFDPRPIRPNRKASVALEGELLKQCERLTDVKDQLKKEIKKVEACRDELMAENIILQRRRQELFQYAREEKASLELPLAQSQPLIASAPQPHRQQHPWMVFPGQEVGPIGISDLNVSPEEYAGGLEYYRQMARKATAEGRTAAAWARRNRSLIRKAKSSHKVPGGWR